MYLFYTFTFIFPVWRRVFIEYEEYFVYEFWKSKTRATRELIYGASLIELDA